MSLETSVLLNGFSIPGLMALPLFNLSPKSFPGYKGCDFLVVPELGMLPLVAVTCENVTHPTEEQVKLFNDLPNTSGYMSGEPIDETNTRYLFRAMPEIEERFIWILEGAFDKLYSSEEYKELLCSTFPEMFDRTWKLISMLSGADNGKNKKQIAD